MEQETSPYRANDPNELIGELFSQKLPIDQALEKLRTRLLDLSANNSLLSYRHPKAKSVQITAPQNIDLIYKRIYEEGKKIRFAYVDEPAPESYAKDRKPEAKIHAPAIGINTDPLFPPAQAAAGMHLSSLQAIAYPAELEKLLRKITTHARTSIEESGSNILYLIFGFLEFYDSPDSEKPMQAPLVSVPVELKRGSLDQRSRTYLYEIAHNGEDLALNQTLHEKLRRDFGMIGEEFDEDKDTLEEFFTRIENSIDKKPRWRVLRQVTLGMLSFSRLAIWADLDPVKNPGLLGHPLVSSIFSGGPAGAENCGLSYAPDYSIDRMPPEEVPPLIETADSSQHSAIIDVLSGKNQVVIGPPGTGKSQTITNIIAAAIAQGKTVLFVSEKMAALDVVRRRLTRAKLGQFCLELHSHKSNKKEILADLKLRMDAKPPSKPRNGTKLTSYKKERARLARYAELMGSKIGNGLGLTVHEILWAAESRRMALGQELADQLMNIRHDAAPDWNHDEMEGLRVPLNDVAAWVPQIGVNGPSHPWWGFLPIRTVLPQDFDGVATLTRTAFEHARKAVEAVAGTNPEPSAQDLVRYKAVLDAIREPPEGAGPLICRMFPQADHGGVPSATTVSALCQAVEKIKANLGFVWQIWPDRSAIDLASVSTAERALADRVKPDLLEIPVAEVKGRAESLLRAAGAFSAVLTDSIPFGASSLEDVRALAAHSERVEELGLGLAETGQTRDCMAQVQAVITQIRLESSRVMAVATRHNLALDLAPANVDQLARSLHLPGLLDPAPAINIEKLVEARGLIGLPLNDKPLDHIRAVLRRFVDEITACAEAVEQCRRAAERLGYELVLNPDGIAALAALAGIAAEAPIHLLEYRSKSLEAPDAAHLAAQLQGAAETCRNGKAALDSMFYLDSLPPAEELKRSIQTLRLKTWAFSFLNKEWRTAKNLHAALSKNPSSGSGRQRADELALIVAWQAEYAAFLADPDFQRCFGRLWKGLETNIESIQRLIAWYTRSRDELARHPILRGRVSLSEIDAGTLLDFAANAPKIQAAAKRLQAADAVFESILGTRIAEFAHAVSLGWPEAISRISQLADRLEETHTFFSAYATPEVSPQEALTLLETKADLEPIRPDIENLRHGVEHLRAAGGKPLGNRFASLAGGPWPEVIPLMQKLADFLTPATALAIQVAGPGGTWREACAFARAWLALEAAWASMVAAPPGLGRFSRWDDFAEAARADGQSVADIFSQTIFEVPSPVSPGRIFKAAQLEAEAREQIARLDANLAVQQLLGEFYRGLDTDLDAIKAAFDWGKTVTESKLPADLRQALVCEDPKAALARVRNLYETAEKHLVAMRNTLEGFRAYGEFNWSLWLAPTRKKQPGVDFPSEIFLRLQAADSARAALAPWAKFHLALSRIQNTPELQAYVPLIIGGLFPPEKLVAAFEFVAYQSMARAVYAAHPDLAGLGGVSLEEARRKFRDLDREIIESTGTEFASQLIRQAKVPDGTKGVFAADYSELALLEREINKRSKHIPIRQLIRRAGKAIRALKPVWMMGPASVAQYLDQDPRQFDLVVMDEASQLKPEESIGAIARGRQLVVVGDPCQLPPTRFFDRNIDNEDDQNAAAVLTGMESILDICQILFTPIRSLRWHYRSQHESLIAFSNLHFYENRLVVFPSAMAQTPELGVKYRHVRDGIYKDRKNLPEAQRVVDAVVEHILTRPDESLGVVTMNLVQRDLIEDLLDQKFRAFGSQVGRYLSKWEEAGWPFFVKNLETVQGDERDVIIVSTTFGRALGAEKVQQHFSALSRSDGWRRLNVLFSRAKRRIILFSSLVPEDINVSDNTPLGTRALRAYLDYARRGTLAPLDESVHREPDSDFEVAVAKVIRPLGYEVIPQLGVAGFFLDIAVRMPNRRGEYLAGIECDGAAYHSEFSVRDRDRIRQEVIESLGWRGKIYRIWSTDWFQNPIIQTARLLEFLRGLEIKMEQRPELDTTTFFQEIGEDIHSPARQQLLAEDQGEPEVAEGETEVNIDPTEAYVEVGDKVTFIYTDSPDPHVVRIIGGASSNDGSLLNESAPLAQALLGQQVGEEMTFTVGTGCRTVRILKIQAAENSQQRLF